MNTNYLDNYTENENIYMWINPVNGIITSVCTQRINPILNKLEFHNGIDIACDLNTSVVAVQNGVVTESYYSQSFGNVLKYKTDNGYIVMYAHLNKALVEVGDRVEKGQIVALSGSTGLSTGAHLHYTIYNGDTVIDPSEFLDIPYVEGVKAEFVYNDNSNQNAR